MFTGELIKGLKATPMDVLGVKVNFLLKSNPNDAYI
jgi:hypothetical protein